MAGLIPLLLDLELAEQFGIYQMEGEISPLTVVSTSPRAEQSEDMMAMKRSTVKAPASLRVLPYTTAEWKRVLAEVKREYINRRFRPCSNRCHEVLDNIRDGDVVERAYIIFLHFYAASALDMQVRSLHHSSTHRSKLLQQARVHYRRASDLARAEDEAMAVLPSPSPTPAPRSPSSLASLHSPAGSISSASTVSTRTSSPSPSMPNLNAALTPKRKKRVQFCVPPVAEPAIRPDSPTLGFDEWLGRSSPDLINAADPDLVRHAVEEPPILVLNPERPVPGLEQRQNAERRESQHDAPAEELNEGPFHRTRSLDRYCSLLSGIRGQIASHLSALEDDIAAAQTPAPPAPRNDEMKAMQLRARIERLRAEGWPRRRLDARRYEALRENAMADMMA